MNGGTVVAITIGHGPSWIPIKWLFSKRAYIPVPAVYLNMILLGMYADTVYTKHDRFRALASA